MDGPGDERRLEPCGPTPSRPTELPKLPEARVMVVDAGSAQVMYQVWFATMTPLVLWLAGRFAWKRRPACGSRSS